MHLLVKPNFPGDEDSLCEMSISLTKIHTNAGAGFGFGRYRSYILISIHLSHTHTDDESYWRPHPISSNYVALGDIFQSGMGSRGSFDQDMPKMRGQELKTLRAVRKSLCVKATLSEKSVSHRNLCEY